MNFAVIRHELSVYTGNPCGSKRESFVFFIGVKHSTLQWFTVERNSGICILVFTLLSVGFRETTLDSRGPHSRRDVLRKGSVGFIECETDDEARQR